MSNGTREDLCACGCGRRAPIVTRGLIKACYHRAERAGTLLTFPRRSRPIAELLEDYTELRSFGNDDEAIATRLGIKTASLKRQLQRARNRGLLTTGSPKGTTTT